MKTKFNIILLAFCLILFCFTGNVFASEYDSYVNYAIKDAKEYLDLKNCQYIISTTPDPNMIAINVVGSPTKDINNLDFISFQDMGEMSLMFFNPLDEMYFSQIYFVTGGNINRGSYLLVENNMPIEFPAGVILESSSNIYNADGSILVEGSNKSLVDTALDLIKNDSPTIGSSIFNSLKILVPIGLVIMAIFIGINLIPRIIYKFL